MTACFFNRFPYIYTQTHTQEEKQSGLGIIPVLVMEVLMSDGEAAAASLFKLKYNT